MPATNYASDGNLAARQRLWRVSERVPAFDLHAWVLGIADVRPGERAIEVGCGNGDYLTRLPTMLGTDLSPGILVGARVRTTSPLAVADAQALPFPDASFDVVLAPHVLYHVPDRAEAARELRRVTRPGGRCIVVTNGASHQRELVALVSATGWRWDRPHDAFSLENGEGQLRTAFDDVALLDAPESVVRVTDADALADYVASLPGVPDDVVDHCRARIARDGALDITTKVGAFVCR